MNTSTTSSEAERSDGYLRQGLLRVAVLRMSSSEIDIAVWYSGSSCYIGVDAYEFDG